MHLSFPEMAGESMQRRTTPATAVSQLLQIETCVPGCICRPSRFSKDEYSCDQVFTAIHRYRLRLWEAQ